MCGFLIRKKKEEKLIKHRKLFVFDLIHIRADVYYNQKKNMKCRVVSQCYIRECHALVLSSLCIISYNDKLFPTDYRGRIIFLFVSSGMFVIYIMIK